MAVSTGSSHVGCRLEIEPYKWHAKQALKEMGEKPNICPKCGRETFNRRMCSICWGDILDQEEMVTDSCGYELGGGFI